MPGSVIVVAVGEQERKVHGGSWDLDSSGEWPSCSFINGAKGTVILKD